MERITKVVFDPLATTKAQIRALLNNLPIGSAHPFSPERLLLCRAATGVEEIDISSYPESHFFNAVDLGELGQTLQTRMTKFASQLQTFNDEYTVQQAPTAIFKVPIESDKIAILAVSERYPTYYDLCVADAECKTTCYGSTASLTGMRHSGDINVGNDLLHHIKVNERLQSGKEFAVFVSGFQCTKLTRFHDRNPVVMIANHTEKALYIVPVPLDAASIGDATICSPVVFKRDGESLICSILPTPTSDLGKMCSGSSLQSTSFPEAIQRADWTVSAPPVSLRSHPAASFNTATPDIASTLEAVSLISTKQNAVFVTQTTVLPSIITPNTTQIIRFGTGLEFLSEAQEIAPESSPSAVVLPCIFGSRLEGPLLLATGKTPENVPFHDEQSLRAYYEDFESAVVFVDERMTDNARNLATPWRMNAVFILQMTALAAPKDGDAILDLINISAVTALAGPQSLVLVQITEKYYFYRGIANRSILNTSNFAFGSDVTKTVESTGLESLLDPRAKRMINLRDANTVLLPSSGKMALPQDLKDLFQILSLNQIHNLEDDISAIVPQLQVLMNQKDLVDLSRALISVFSAKIGDATAPRRTAYINFLTKEYEMLNPDSVKKKNSMLGDLRKDSKRVQKSLESIITHLSNMMSSQTTSKRTHDLKRLERQSAIQNNVEAVKSMTFDTLAGLLEMKAAEMGVLLLNIETTPYKQLLGNLKANSLNVNPCCDLDARVLFLEGFDAGIILEQSQSNHDGPLKHQLGASHPVLALPYLSQERGTGSMLAWVCWDEFVNLETPFEVRWMEKCNESHIAALRVMMRDTLSSAVTSREYNMQPGSPETGQLMSALMMAAMSKLAAMRTSAPTRTITAQDTVTKLMRGLFGNLLTTAGSGVRPMSMVWQLFGREPKLEVPATAVAWSWYETVVRLYPFTGWPQEQFNLNLEKLLDKALLAIITKNEITEKIKITHVDRMVKYCQLRNIQLDHSRSIVTIFIQMMNSDVDRSAIATRLLAALPSHLPNQTQSYPKMLRYLKYVASTGSHREEDDIVVVSVYLKRSAVFKAFKQSVAQACRDNNNAEIKKHCLALMAKFNEIVESWKLQHAKLIMQNFKAYQGLLDTHCDEGVEMEDFAKTQRKDLMHQVISDAEKSRVPWQVGKEGEFGDDIEPVDEAFVHEIMTGEKAPVFKVVKQVVSGTHVAVKPVGMMQFSSLVNGDFITKMENVITSQDVCKIMNVPVSAMRAFATALNPEFEIEKHLGLNFKNVVIALLSDRKEREKQWPVRRLFGMVERESEGGIGPGIEIELEG
ncbi:uncharacterized protein K444DRAFT_646257 [Hyaloscypha bicolor E]|uniref:Uncharacterized protein n=1 Tax=Hyaloscypha bicolor E TaxID=1095630 RepID=A0A2J6SUF7_9HELO|nr:uncharacterized protein K444DRAFT_646257 [Hyaloscypha bicolor E]PMD54408.1 hypothetical protein K444DRAFT_646257 [Hyaloscypha bicolor E]